MQRADLELGLRVQQVLNTTIRPLLNVDAGDVEVTSVQDGHVTLTLLGSCSRCAFRASCAPYSVLDRLDDALGDGHAGYSITGLSVDRVAARLAPPAGTAAS